ncbi:MAG TPA: hypothetical protein VF806_01010 [Anaerolineaceae bacterium]
MALARVRIVIPLLIAFMLFACTPAVTLPFAQPATGAATGAPVNPQTSDPSTAFQGPLSVVITSPADEDTVTASPVEFSGRANPGTVININDSVVLVGATRAFHVKVNLATGDNLVEITASDPQGGQGTAYMSIQYQP